jgi:hypothetical protein
MDQTRPEIHIDLVRCHTCGLDYSLRVWANLQGTQAPFATLLQGYAFGKGLVHVLSSAGFIVVESGLMDGSETIDPPQVVVKVS